MIGGLEKFPAPIMRPDPSLRQRLFIAAILVPLFILFAWIGGWPFATLVAIIITLAAFELWQLFYKGGFAPSILLMLVFTALLILLRHLFNFQYSDLQLAALILAAMVYHVLELQKGGESSAVSFFLTLGGPLYLGWLGAYAVSIRDLNNGFYWVILVVASIAIADTGAYAIGRRFGRHKMFPRVSPHKSWEGYIAGIISGTLAGWGIAALWHGFIPAILPVHGIILGAVISILAPMGDFGESMLKRFFNVKDSGTILLDHGGFLDRIDSILWAITIGYYLIIFITG